LEVEEKETERQWSMEEMSPAKTTSGFHAVTSPLRVSFAVEKVKALR